MKSMHSCRGRIGIPALILLIFFFAGSYLIPGSTWGLTLSEEKTLGRKVLEAVKEQMPLIEDGEIVTYVQSIGNGIIKNMGTTLYDYQFFVVDQSDVNAFAVPGGFVFVFRGLIETLQTEGELASIISHELAHVQARHVQRRMEQGRILSIASLVGLLAGAFLGGDASRAVAMGSMAGAKSLELKYSRENEEEADQLGFRYLCDAGYDPAHMVEAMQAMSQSRFHRSSVPSYLSTHPDISERIQYLQVMVEDYRDKRPITADKGQSPEYQLVRAALVSEYSDPRVAMSRFKTEMRHGSEAAVYGLGRLYLRQGQSEAAISQLQDAAARYPDSPLVLTTLGAAYFQIGRLDEAHRVLQSAILMDASSTSARFRLALVLIDLGKRDQALQHLQQIEKYAPSFPQIDYQMGVLLGQMNQLASAHYHLGRFYQYERDWDNAVFHYRKARVLLKGDPRKLAEIDEELKEIGKKHKKMARDVFKDNRWNRSLP
jgi:beta-barrel assembly-enhancing protease